MTKPFQLTHAELQSRARTIDAVASGMHERTGTYQSLEGRTWEVTKDARSIVLSDTKTLDMGAYLLNIATSVGTYFRVDGTNFAPISVAVLTKMEAAITEGEKADTTRDLLGGRSITLPVVIDGIVLPQDLSQPGNMLQNAAMYDEWSARLPHIIIQSSGGYIET